MLKKKFFIYMLLGKVGKVFISNLPSIKIYNVYNIICFLSEHTHTHITKVNREHDNSIFFYFLSFHISNIRKYAYIQHSCKNIIPV